MRCARCHTPLSESDRFCPQCGQKRELDPGSLHEQALQLYHRGQTEAAVALWDDAVALHPDISLGN